MSRLDLHQFVDDFLNDPSLCWDYLENKDVEPFPYLESLPVGLQITPILKDKCSGEVEKTYATITIYDVPIKNNTYKIYEISDYNRNTYFIFCGGDSWDTSFTKEYSVVFPEKQIGYWVNGVFIY